MEPVDVVMRVAALTVIVCSVLVVLGVMRAARARRAWEERHRGGG